MRQKIVSPDFFKNAILNGEEKLLDEFSPNVVEHHIGSDSFFQITPKTHHYRVNKKICNLILNHAPINSSACGFVSGKSYYDFLSPHINGYYFLRLDIKKFFHSIKISDVREVLSVYFSSEKGSCNFSPLDIALSATTHNVSSNFSDHELKKKNILPIGFPSSPVISNIIFRRIDILIQKYCENKKITYSRYADDLLFSSYDSKFIHSDGFEREISIYLSTLSLNLKKKKRVQAEHTISLNGYTITNKKNNKNPRTFQSILAKINDNKNSGSIRLSNKKLKVIKKLCHEAKKGESSYLIMESLFNQNRNAILKKYGNNTDFYKKYSLDQLQNKINGYRSYLISIINYNKKNNCIESQCVKTIEGLVSSLEEINCQR